MHEEHNFAPFAMGSYRLTHQWLVLDLPTCHSFSMGSGLKRRRKPHSLPPATPLPSILTGHVRWSCDTSSDGSFLPEAGTGSDNVNCDRLRRLLYLVFCPAGCRCKMLFRACLP
jgi:hypothetical protein